jgi:hypothetical protein
VLAGLLTGGAAAAAYYSSAARPLAHTFVLWTALVALASARQPARRAVVRAVLALAAAVLAFYLGKAVVHGLRYPGTSYLLSGTQVAEWLVLAAVAGTLLGWVFCRIGRPGTAGALAAAAALGLLAADTWRRWNGYPDEGPVVAVAAVAAGLAVLAVDVRSARRLAVVAAWTPPCALAGYLLVSLPDLLEQLLVTL